MIHFIEDDAIKCEMERVKSLVDNYGQRLLKDPDQRLFDEYYEAKTKYKVFEAFLKLDSEEKRVDAIKYGCGKLFENNLAEPYRRGFKDALTTICNRWNVEMIMNDLYEE